MKPTLLLICAVLFANFLEAQNFAWAKQFTGPNDNYGRSIAIDITGNVYTAGYLNGTVDFDPGPGVFNLTQASGAGAYISKLDVNGNFIWAKQFVSWNIVVYDIELDASGNIYTSGFFQQIADFDPGPGVYNLTNVLGSDAFISKLDNNGNFVWAKQFGGINNIYLGSNDIVLDATGSVISTGYFNGTADFDPGPGVFNLTPAGLEDIYVAKLDVNGNYVWAVKMSGTSFEHGQAVGVDGAGNIYSAGYFGGTVDFDPGPSTFNMTATNNSDIYVSKLDINGIFTWAKQISGSTQASVQSISVSNSGNLTITGGFRNTMDADPGPGTYNLIAIDVDIHLIKLDGGGNFIWAAQFGGSGQDRGQAVSVDASGTIYLTGDFHSTVDFDPGPSVLNFTSAGGFDIFISKIDVNGNLIWAKQIGGSGDDIGYAVVSDILENVYSSGLFETTADFDPGPGVVNLTSGGSGDSYVLKLSHCTGATSSFLDIFSCTPYTLNGQTYTATGVYIQTLINAAGCDSIITLNLTIGGSTTSTSVSACDSYFWEGQTYTTSGNYTVVYIGADGCDSTLQLNLTIKNSVATAISITICDGQSYAGYTVAGTYIDTYVAANGCDSIRTLYLTVNPKSLATINAIICEGQSYAGYTVSGTYTDTYVAANGCDSIRTLNLVVNPRKFTSATATICNGQSYFVGGANQTNPGIYKDTLQTSFGCDSIITTTLTVNPKPQPSLGADRNLCAGTSVTFDPGSFNTYVWQDLSTLPVFFANSIGLYWVTVTNSFNCSATDSIRINNINTLPAGFLKQSDSICTYENLIIQPLLSFDTYLWSNGSTQSYITVLAAGQYWLRVSDNNGCTGADTITLFPKQCITGVFIPTGFTPNGDGKNDVFKALIYGNVVSFNLEVYDRAGQLVFKTSDPLKGWNGMYGGIYSSNSVFVWQCFYQLKDEKSQYKKGTVTVIR